MHSNFDKYMCEVLAPRGLTPTASAELQGLGSPPSSSRVAVVLEKTLKSPLDCKEIQPVHSEGDQPWDFFGRNDAKAETPVLWPPHATLGNAALGALFA